MPAIDPARATTALSAKQLKSIAQAQERINIWSGAIRSGKTVSSLLAWLIYIATDAPQRGRLVMVGRTKETINRNVFAVLGDPALFGPLADEVHYTAGAPTATILGRVVDVIGANDARAEGRLRGLTCAGAYVDEATLIQQEFWTQLLGRMSVKGARLFATTNPDNPAHWLRRDFILRGRDLRLAHWHFTLDDNPGLEDEYKDSIKAEFTGLWYRRFILGHWVAAEGAIYDMWDEERHVVNDLPLITRWLALGIDHGTTNPFAGELVGVGADRRLYVVSEYRYDSRQKHKAMTDAEYSVAVRAWLDDVPIPGAPNLRGAVPEWTCVDPSAASFVQQLYRDGITPIKARNSVLDGIRNVATLLGADRLRVHRSCQALIDEFPGYSWSDEKALRGEDAPVKVDDHSLDALRYAIHTTEASWRAAIPINSPGTVDE